MRSLQRACATVATAALLVGGPASVASADEKPARGVPKVSIMYAWETTVSITVDGVVRPSQSDWISKVVGDTFRNRDWGLGAYSLSRKGRLHLLMRGNGRMTPQIEAGVRYLHRTRPWYHVSAGEKTVTKGDVFFPNAKASSAGLVRLKRALPKLKNGDFEMDTWSTDSRHIDSYYYLVSARRKVSQQEWNAVARAVERTVGTKPSHMIIHHRNDITT